MSATPLETARRIMSEGALTPELLGEAGLSCWAAHPMEGSGLRVYGLGGGVAERELRYLACYASLENGRRSDGTPSILSRGLRELRDFTREVAPVASLRDPGEKALRTWRLYDAYWSGKRALKGHPELLEEMAQRSREAGVDFRGLSEDEVVERTARLVEAAQELSRYDGSGTPPRDPFAADLWRIDIISEVFGIGYNESLRAYHVNFLRIADLGYRELAKRFIKSRIVGGKGLALSTAAYQATCITRFLDFVAEGVTGGLPGLTRRDMEEYLATLDPDGRDLSASAVDGALGCIKGLIEWLQQREHPLAPAVPSNLLVLSGDYRGVRVNPDDVKETPAHVLEALSAHWQEIDEDVRCLLSILNKTGLRISDALQLDRSCLALEPDGWWIVRDIEKIPIEQHRLPIDEELAGEIKSFASRPECRSEEANPRHFLFVNPGAKRRGGPWLQDEMRGRINELLGRFGVIGDGGEPASFRFHGMRHRYAMGVLNSGADIRDVQELLGHRSAAMTEVYAHLTEDRKRTVFRKAVERGLFTFVEGEAEMVLEGCDISEALFEALWANAKLMARDTPFGVCAARKGKPCPNASSPPCLTIAGGRPCPHLSVGLTEMDAAKYEVYAEAAGEMEELGRRHGNPGMAEAAAAERAIYSDILGKLKDGAVIVGPELLLPEPQSASRTSE